MFKLIIVIVIIACSADIASAYTISGKVISEKGDQPIEFVNVFIANTTFGTISDSDGKFSLKVNFEGRITLVVTHIGYTTYSVEMEVNSDIDSLIVKISEKIYPLNDIEIVGSKELREKYYEMFKSILLGKTQNSEHCTINNPQIVKFISKKDKGILKAYTDTFLIIRNEALGYIIKYKIENFIISKHESIYYGYAYFQDISDSLNRKKKNLKRRLDAYNGSQQHFLKSLYNMKLKENGFYIFQITELPKDSAEKIKSPFERCFYHDVFVKNTGNTLLLRDMILKLYPYLSDTTNDWKQLNYSSPFMIKYKNSKRRDLNSNSSKGILQDNNSQTTLVMLRKGNVFFDKYGTPLNPTDFMMYGNMTWKRVADMLPLDFDPEQTEKELKDL